MAKDLRSFLKKWEQKYPQDVIRVKNKVKVQYEIPAIQVALEEDSRYPALLFENTENLYGRKSDFPVVTNLFASRRRCAECLGIHPRRVAIEYAEKEARSNAPVEVSKKAAPVKDVVMKGKDVDLFRFPIITHHEMDSAPYITAGVVTTRDPDTGAYNLALQRVEVKARDRTGVGAGARGPKALIFTPN